MSLNVSDSDSIPGLFQGPFSATDFYPQRDIENWIRVCQLIFTIAVDLFRDTLSGFMNPLRLKSLLDEQNLYQKFEKLFFSKTTLSIEICLHRLLYRLLQKWCNMSQHKNGWGNMPDLNDNCLAACIDRIMIQGRIITDSKKIGISDCSFQEIWKTLQNDILEIERQAIGGRLYEEKVNDLFEMDISLSMSERYIDECKYALCTIIDYNLEKLMVSLILFV